MNNETINLNRFENSLVIINFWATWCAPCVEEMPSLDLLKTPKTKKNNPDSTKADSIPITKKLFKYIFLFYFLKTKLN